MFIYLLIIIIIIIIIIIMVVVTVIVIVTIIIILCLIWSAFELYTQPYHQIICFKAWQRQTYTLV